MPDVPHSGYMDMAGYGLVPSGTSVADAYGFSASDATAATSNVVVALTLNRANGNDPTALLSQDWAQREATIQSTTQAGTLWTTYGANATDYGNAQAAVQNSLGTLPQLGSADGGTSSDGYVSSAASRTIWLNLTPTQFQQLFGTALLSSPHGLQYWNGDLSLPSGLASLVNGIWVDTGTNLPKPSTTTTTENVNLAQGAQSIGNSGGETGIFPNQLASTAYNFPLSASSTTPTGTIALVEKGAGDGGVKSGHTFQSLLDDYRTKAGITTPGNYYAVETPEVSPGNSNNSSGERSLDVGVVATAAPNSRIGLYAGGDGGTTMGTAASTFSADMEIIWDATNNPSIMSSSFSDEDPASPNSPFYAAYNALMQDAALRNISMFFSAGDGGSQEKYGSGLPMTDQSHSSQYAVVVGGSSLANFGTAANDTTLSSLLASAQAMQPAALWSLIQGGLTVSPSTNTDMTKTFVESVWNQYYVTGSTITEAKGAGDIGTGGYDANNAGAGGVDTTQATPGYQTAFGLTPTNTAGQTGRGVPDVSSTAGGDSAANVPGADMSGASPDGGTSGAAPLWASLTAQIQAVFADQGLPSTGYFTDLLYTAAAIAPASFNDVQIGNNNSTYIADNNGAYTLADGKVVDVTGSGSLPLGYSAGPGYDLATGLGTPNGTILAQTLVAIAQAQEYSSTPALVDSSGAIEVSGSLLVQPSLPSGTAYGLGSTDFMSHVTPSPYQETAQFAGQVQQAGFDPQLVTAFDGEAMTTPHEVTVTAGQALAPTIGDVAAITPQSTLTSPFGFVTATAANGSVTYARPYAIAQTSGGLSDQDAIVSVRQNGGDTTQLRFYKIDDGFGTVNGVAPGQSGYEQAAASSAYKTVSGATWINDPGYGGQMATLLTGVNQGDLIGFALNDSTTHRHYYGFAQANEVGSDNTPVPHIEAFGLNTWGFEDGYQGGDRDYNDAVFHLDFTSNSGHALLAPHLTAS